MPQISMNDALVPRNPDIRHRHEAMMGLMAVVATVTIKPPIRAVGRDEPVAGH
jgi:hypothetical protein